jgi:predicted dehydrogenase
MRIIHIGLGVRGRHWLEIVRDRPDITSVGCVDPEAAALAWIKARFPRLKDACYEKPDQAFRDIAADAVIIASPPAMRASQAIEALEAGLTVMVEKPFATSLAEAAEVMKAARRAGRAMIVAPNYGHGRCDSTLRQLVREGRVGTVSHVSCIDRRSCPAQGNSLAQVGYAQVLDVGAHHFDTLRSILGVNPVSAMARCGKSPWSAHRHGSTTEALLEMEHNVHVHYHGSLTSNRDEHALWIEGDRGVLWTDRSRLWWRKRGWRFFLPIRARKFPAGDGLKYPREGTATLLDQLKGAAVERQPPETNGEDTLWTLSTVEAVMLSDKMGTTVRIADLFHAAGIPWAAPARNGGGVAR